MVSGDLVKLLLLMNMILFPVLCDDGEKEWTHLVWVLGLVISAQIALASANFLIYMCVAIVRVAAD